MAVLSKLLWLKRTSENIFCSLPSHRSVAVRKTAAHYISLVVDKMGANKCLVGPRDVAEHLLPAAAKFVTDPSPVTRFYGRSIFYIVQSHPQFDKLMRRHLSPGMYRNIHGILESLKRRVSFFTYS